MSLNNVKLQNTLFWKQSKEKHFAEQSIRHFSTTLLIESHQVVSKLSEPLTSQPTLVLVLCINPQVSVMKIIKLASQTD